MRMIPSSPYDTGSQAEKLIFDRLRRAFDDRYVAYHSLKPTRHPFKRFPEIDFLICGPEGLYVLEIKGGRIACRNGLWEYQDRNGRTDRSQESPFRQAETALHGLMQDFRDNLPADTLARFITGYGVVFPDCEWRTRGAEWDPAMLADKHRSRDLEGWLRVLFQYWRQRQGGRGQPDDGALKQLQEYLRPEVDTPSETDATLVDQVEGVRRRVERFTDDQMRMADVAEANPRVLCAGGAGTGKTFLAERLARRWAEAGLEVALVCRSPWLRHFLASRLSMPGLTVSLIDGVRLDCRRAGLERFDALIVDEGQDLFEMRCIETLDGVLAGGLEAGRWCWFHDLNNQSLTHRFERRAKEYLESLDPVRMPLRINCRNTRVILKWMQDTLGADLGVKGAGAGPDIRRQTVATRRESAEWIAREIVEAGGRRGPRPRFGDDPVTVRLCGVFRCRNASGRRAPGPQPRRVFHAKDPRRQGRIRKDRGIQRSRERGDRRRGPSRLEWGRPERGGPLRCHEPGSFRTVADPPGFGILPEWRDRPRIPD